jgi:hypothetical protein
MAKMKLVAAIGRTEGNIRFLIDAVSLHVAMGGNNPALALQLIEDSVKIADAAAKENKAAIAEALSLE